MQRKGEGEKEIQRQREGEEIQLEREGEKEMQRYREGLNDIKRQGEAKRETKIDIRVTTAKMKIRRKRYKDRKVREIQRQREVWIVTKMERKGRDTKIETRE